MFSADEISQANAAYAELTDGVRTVNGVCEERVLMNIMCYMFNTICGLFNTISAYRSPGTPLLLVVVHLLWVINCAGRITLVCFAASSVVEQVRHRNASPPKDRAIIMRYKTISGRPSAQLGSDRKRNVGHEE